MPREIRKPMQRLPSKTDVRLWPRSISLCGGACLGGIGRLGSAGLSPPSDVDTCEAAVPARARRFLFRIISRGLQNVMRRRKHGLVPVPIRLCEREVEVVCAVCDRDG